MSDLSRADVQDIADVLTLSREKAEDVRKAAVFMHSQSSAPVICTAEGGAHDEKNAQIQSYTARLAKYALEGTGSSARDAEEAAENPLIYGKSALRTPADIRRKNKK